jgi:hypothetical protein
MFTGRQGAILSSPKFATDDGYGQLSAIERVEDTATNAGGAAATRSDCGGLFVSKFPSIFNASKTSANKEVLCRDTALPAEHGGARRAT